MSIRFNFTLINFQLISSCPKFLLEFICIFIEKVCAIAKGCFCVYINKSKENILHNDKILSGGSMKEKGGQKGMNLS